MAAAAFSLLNQATLPPFSRLTSTPSSTPVIVSSSAFQPEIGRQIMSHRLPRVLRAERG